MTSTTAAPQVRSSKKRKMDVSVIDLTGEEPAIPWKRRNSNVSKTRNGQDLGIGASKRIVKVRTVDDWSGARKPKLAVKRHSREPKPSIESGRPTKGKGDRKPPNKVKQSTNEEKRLRRYRTHAPSAYLEVRDRALTQRMFALDRQRNNENPDHPTETVSLAGTTGNVYTITIDKVPSCDCPHARKGNQCKHVAYVLSRVLRAPAHLEYQLAFISSELREIFAKAPPLPSETAESDSKDGNRKPIEGECPICCVDFEPESREEILYCKAACGNNIHKDCFGQWAATKTGGKATCPFCRTPWQSDSTDLKHVAKSGNRNAEGYVNVASQLGLSGKRDYSSYHSYWVRNQAIRGRISWDEDEFMGHEYR